jgi:5'-nucleotidase
MLKIAVSSRSLFHIEDGDRIFQEQGAAAFDAYMREKEDVPLRPGSAFHLIRKLLKLNEVGGERLVEVAMLSRNSPTASLRVMNSVGHYGLDIEKAAFTSGRDRFGYAKGYEVQLFLSANADDARVALQRGIASAIMVPSEVCDSKESGVTVAFDGDSVIFSDEADKVYKELGLSGFREHEVRNATVPLKPGPFFPVLQELHRIQSNARAREHLRIAVVTARGAPAHARVLHSLRHLGVTVDEVVFCGGAPKGPLLKAAKADIFFDDTQKNIGSAVESGISSGHVPYGEGGIVQEAA